MSARCGIALLAVVLGATVARAPAMPATATAPAVSQSVSASGARDGHTPGWTISTDAPVGWTADCCTYARAIGVNLVLYQGDWTGEPNRVMVLNVWPRQLPSLEAEQQVDTKHFLARDRTAKVGSFPVRHRTMQCAATVFQGTDHVDDVVVFCDPGKASGIRLSWSMSFADSDPTRAVLLGAFMHVVVATRYMRNEHVVPSGNLENRPHPVIPAKAGIHVASRDSNLDPAFANDEQKLSPFPSSKPPVVIQGDVGLT